MSCIINCYILALQISLELLYNENVQIYINDIKCYCSSEQSDLVGGIPAHSRELELDDI